jgi:hypothetical protein
MAKSAFMKKKASFTRKIVIEEETSKMLHMGHNFECC